MESKVRKKLKKKIVMLIEDYTTALCWEYKDLAEAIIKEIELLSPELEKKHA